MKVELQKANVLISRLNELDWDFAGDKSDSPFADLHFHPGRFVPQIPAALIGSLTSERAFVVDPFCGSGTTLVEASRLGRSALGIDINPISCLVSRAKTIPKSSSEIEAELLALIDQLTAFLMIDAPGEIQVPAGVQLGKWYHAETGAQLARIWSFIRSKVGEDLHDLALFCFSSSLMSCCAETRSWGYVCDNVRPLERRYVDAFMVFRERIEAVIDAYRRRDRRQLAPTILQAGEITVEEGDAAERLKELGEGTVDLVVTSPPYFGVVDYIKSQRLSFEWFGLGIEQFRTDEIGARSKRHRQAAFAEYTQELGDVMRQIYRILKPSHSAAFVIGESAKRVAALDEVTRMLTAAGFSIDLSISRKIGLRRRQPASLQSERLIVATKVA